MVDTGYVDVEKGRAQMNKLESSWEVRKCQGEGWNIYVILPGPQPMFCAHLHTERDVREWLYRKHQDTVAASWK